MSLLDIILGYDCNLACDYCTITPEMRLRSLSPQKVVAAMREMREMRYERVAFTGGEPTIRGDLLGLIGAANQLGFADIKVQSNGLLFSQRNNVDRIVHRGATSFHVSIHTHLADAYDTMVRREGAFSLMERGLRHLVEGGLNPRADVIMTRETHARLADAVRWLFAIGVRRADLWFVSLTDGNRDNLESMPKMSEVVPSMAKAFDAAAELGVELRSLHVPRCLLGAHADRAFDPAGEEVRVLTPDDDFMLENSALTPQVHVPACEGCPHRPLCRGLRPDYLERYGDAEIAQARSVEPSVPPTRRLRVLS